MKMFFFSLALVFISSSTLSAQENYFVQFTDKAATPYSIDAPEQYLSQKAIVRRSNQGISIDEKDLPVDPAYVSSVDAIPNVIVRYSTKWLNGVVVWCDSLAMVEITQLPMVSGVERTIQWENDFELEVSLSSVDDSGLRLKNMPLIDYGLSDGQITDLNGQALHDLGFEGEGIVISILDSGFDNVDVMAAFDHVRDEDRILSTKDVVEGDENVYDEHSHGRLVLSTIAGIVAGEAYGTAVDASFHLIRTEDTDSESTVEELNWVAGAEYADSVGSDILNTSLGYTTFDEEIQNHSYEDMDGNTTWISRGSDIAASRGMLVVNSAGNSGNSDWFYISAPADGDSVLAIGAVKGDSTQAAFSSFGPTFDGRVKPNVMAKGQGSVVIGASNVPFQANGTSFSSPILAGMAACLWQAVPEATNMEVFHAIEQSAHLYDTPTDALGHGIPDFGLALELLQDPATSVIESNEGALRVYPNPAHEFLTIDLPELIDMNSLSFEMVDISGRLTSPEVELRSGQLQMDVSRVTSGVYLIRISDGQTLYTQRLTVD